MTAPMSHGAAAATLESMNPIFDRVICAVDLSSAGAVAARIGARIASPEGALTLVSVDNTSLMARGMFPVAVAAAQPQRTAEHALHIGRAEADPVHGLWTRRLTGEPVAAILDEVDQRRATLLVIGTHGYRRTTGIAFHLVGSRLIHDVRCSMLVAQRERSFQHWPRSIVVGVDGSAESAAAADAGRDLAARFHASLRLVACTRGRVDLDAARAIGPEVEMLRSRPVDGLRVLS